MRGDGKKVKVMKGGGGGEEEGRVKRGKKVKR